jgi:hypothetical protein
MVRLDYYERLQREQQEQIQREQEARASRRTAGNWIKGILGLATFNENVWRGATSGSTDKFLSVSADADPIEIALGIATMVAFSYAGVAGEKLGLRNPKGGKLLNYKQVEETALSKGYKIDPKLKDKVEAEIKRVNNQTDIEQLKGLNKIRSDTLETISKLINNSKTAGEKAELQKSYNETLIKLQEGGLDIQIAELNKADPSKQYKRDGLNIKEDLEANVEYLNKLDPYKQYSVKDNKIVEDLQKTVESLNKLDPKIQFKVENNAIIRVREAADPEVIRRNEEITQENLRIAEESIRKMNERIKKANEEAKAEDKKIDKEAEEDEKGIPDGDDEIIQTQEKLTDEDKPDFSDETENKNTEEIENNIKKVSGAGAASIMATQVVEKLTRGDNDETRRRRNFELVDTDDTIKTGFTNEPVKEGEPKTESSKQTADITYATNYKEQIIKNTNNIDELFQITIDLCEKVYNPESITEGDRFFYFGIDKFKVPILLHIYKRTLYITFRGTDSFDNIITDITTSETSIFNFEINSRSNFLYSHHPFDDVLDKKYSNIEFHLGIIKSIQESFGFLIEKIKELKNSINNIVVSGHSLGGACAQLFTYIYTNSNQKITNEKKIIYTITYGQPRILFNKPEYITLFNENIQDYIRVWNGIDPVPYLPFKKQFDIEQMAESRIMSGYTHVGRSFDLTGNIVNNDVNLLLYEILKGSKEQIQILLENKDLLLTSKLIQFILSPQYLQLNLYSFYNCLNSVNIVENITEAQLNFIIKQLQNNIEKLNSYNDKCDLLKPFGLSEILKLNPISDDVDDENFSLSCIAGCSIKMNRITKKAHETEYYHKKIDELINRQIDENKAIFETIENEDGLFQNPKEIDTNLFFKNVQGLYIGNYQDGELIEF